MDAIIAKLGWQFVDAFECGLLWNKRREYLATSLDAWLVMKYNELSDAEHSIRSNFEDDVLSIDHCNYHCELKIKTPSSKTLIQEIIEKCVDLHGMVPFLNANSTLLYSSSLFTHSSIGDKKLHHATVATSITFFRQYAVLIGFPEQKLACT